MSFVSRVDTIFVPAADTEAAARWYSEMFVMEEIFRSGRHIGLRFAGTGARGTAVTFIPLTESAIPSYVAFNLFTADPVALRMQLIDAGVEVTEINEGESLRWFDFVDPSGNRVNVCHYATGD